MSNTVPSRISPLVAWAATGALFGIAILAYLCRLYTQLSVHKRFFAEDWVLLFAVIVLVANTAIYYVLFPHLRRTLELTWGVVNAELISEVFSKIPIEAREMNAIVTLWWITIFLVKMAYLLFFRNLIARLKNLERYWWFVTAFTIAALIACVVAEWQDCPYTNTVTLIAKCAGNKEVSRSVNATITTTVFDVLSDTFIASIPICLLWRVRIAMRQKIGLGMILCLSLVMVVFALVRGGGMHLSHDVIDAVWLAFWQQNECNIAVIMFSLTAFRSFFVPGDGEGGRFEWLATVCRRLKSKLSKLFPGTFSPEPEGSYYDNHGQLPSEQGDQPMVQSQEPAIPAPTISGMRTAIDKAGSLQEELRV